MGRLQDMLKSYKSEGRSNETKMWESILLMDEMFEGKQTIRIDLKLCKEFIYHHYRLFLLIPFFLIPF